MKIQSFFIFALLLTAFISSAQTPDWIWARQSSLAIYDMGESLATDPDGNIIVSGNFLCCNLAIGNDTLSGYGEHDLFLAKYDNQGNMLWARSAGGDDEEPVSSVDCDNNGNIFVAGYFRSDTMMFDAVQIYNSDTGPLNTHDIYLAKYDSAGTLLWAKSFSGNREDQAADIHVDETGNLFITGFFTSDTLFFDNHPLTANGLDQLYIAKLDTDGNVIWAQEKGLIDAYGKSITTDQNGNITITGHFDGTALQFATFYIVMGNCITSNCTDYFVASFDSTGTVRWVGGVDGPGNGYVRGINVNADTQGNVLVTGTFESASVIFDADTLRKNNGQSSSGGDAFIVKYDTSGSVSWSQRIGGSADDRATGVVADQNNNVFITGWASGFYITCGLDSFPGLTLGYVAKFNASGTTAWVKSVPGKSNAITLDTLTHAYISGYYTTPQAVFNNDTLINPSSNNNDYFIAKLDSLSGVISTIGIGHINADAGLIVHPNPFTTSVTLVPKSGFHNAEITLYDVYGTKIRIISGISGSEFILERENLSPGMYFFSIEQQQQSLYTGKLIVR